jgi:hypothetical protein
MSPANTTKPRDSRAMPEVAARRGRVAGVRASEAAQAAVPPRREGFGA